MLAWSRKIRARLHLARAKYFLAVGAVMKNEAHVLEEWLDHYANEGVDHFYLIDDASTDDTPAVLAPWITSGRVTLVADAARHDQLGKYHRHLTRALSECAWLAVVDLDEFLYARTGTLAGFLRVVPEDVGAVVVPWKNFGSSGHVEQPASVVDGFLRRRDYGSGRDGHCKSIVRGAATRRLHVHAHPLRRGYAWMDGAGERRAPRVHGPAPARLFVTEELLSRSLLQLNHYPIQSRRWFEQVKMTRGDVLHPENDRVRDANYFGEYDRNDVYDDELSRKRSSRARPDP
jgi:hypothetical protein